ncbi:MAG: porin family protein [Colwellia sp.]|nr:porin family protein [Colwellia sp.]
MLGKKAIILSLLLASLLAGYASDAAANQTKRAGKWESTFQFSNTQSFDINGAEGSGVDVDNDLGWGFTFGYNVNEHILVNFEWMASSPKYTATFVNDDGQSTSIKHKMDIYTTQVNGIYHFTRDQFTPFIQAGLGWSYIDSNIANGPPVGGCWYDPWWGYICDSYQSTYDDTRFSYNVAAGFRYEIDTGLTIKASYKQLWMDLSNSKDASMGIFHLEIGSYF